MPRRVLASLLAIAIAMFAVFALAIQGLHLRGHPRGPTVTAAPFHTGP